MLVQSTRSAAHREALDRLQRAGRLYGCDCTRADSRGPYPGTCRRRALPPAVGSRIATRFALRAEDPLDFIDRWQGPHHYTAAALGDPVVWRRDGLIAYQLAVVVDDAHQAVSDVVRGADLLDSTPWQLALYTALGSPPPTHAHGPLVTEPDGTKLAKFRRSVPLDAGHAGAELWRALRLLGQAPPAPLIAARPAELLAWAVPNWSPARFRNRGMVAADADENLGSRRG